MSRSATKFGYVIRVHWITLCIEYSNSGFLPGYFKCLIFSKSANLILKILYHFKVKRTTLWLKGNHCIFIEYLEQGTIASNSRSCEINATNA